MFLKHLLTYEYFNRLLSTALILEGREMTTLHTSSLSGLVTSASMEILECLIEKNTPSHNCASAEYVEVC